MTQERPNRDHVTTAGVQGEDGPKRSIASAGVTTGWRPRIRSPNVSDRLRPGGSHDHHRCCHPPRARGRPAVGVGGRSWPVEDGWVAPRR